MSHSSKLIEAETNGRHFADDIFKCIFLNQDVWIPIKISLKFVPKGPINNIPALVQIMASRRPGDKPLSEIMMVSLPTHICVSRSQSVRGRWAVIAFIHFITGMPKLPKLSRTGVIVFHYIIIGEVLWGNCTVCTIVAAMCHTPLIFYELISKYRQQIK